MEQSGQSPRKFKSFTYHTAVEWKEARQGMVSSDGKPTLPVSSPPEFKGVPGVWTPEDLFVAAVEVCTMTTFLSFAERKGLPLKSYRSTAEGLLENTDGKYRFTTITIRPEIVAGSGWTKEQVEELVHQAHDNCLIASSMSSKVVIEPAITVA